MAFRLHLRRQVCLLVLSASRLASALAAGPPSIGRTLFADHTYLQQAQPSTSATTCSRSRTRPCGTRERLLEVVAWLNASPCGAGAVNGSRLVDRTSPVGRRSRVRPRHRQHPGRHVAGRRARSAGGHRGQPGLHPDLAGRGPGDLVEQRVRLRRSGGRLHPPERAHAAEAQPVRAVDDPRRHGACSSGKPTGLLAVQKSPSARSDSLIFAYGEMPGMLDQGRRLTELTAGVVETLEVNEARLRDAARRAASPRPPISPTS